MRSQYAFTIKISLYKRSFRKNGLTVYDWMGWQFAITFTTQNPQSVTIPHATLGMKMKLSTLTYQEKSKMLVLPCIVAFKGTMLSHHVGVANCVRFESVVLCRVLGFLVWQALASQIDTLLTRFMGPTSGPSGAGRSQVGPILAPWTLLSG